MWCYSLTEDLNFKEHNCPSAETRKRSWDLSRGDPGLRSSQWLCISHQGLSSYLASIVPSNLSHHLKMNNLWYPASSLREVNMTQIMVNVYEVLRGARVCYILNWAGWACQRLTFFFSFYLPNGNFNSSAHTHCLCLGHVLMKYHYTHFIDDEDWNFYWKKPKNIFHTSVVLFISDALFCAHSWPWAIDYMQVIYNNNSVTLDIN